MKTRRRQRRATQQECDAPKHRGQCAVSEKCNLTRVLRCLATERCFDGCSVSHLVDIASRLKAGSKRTCPGDCIRVGLRRRCVDARCCCAVGLVSVRSAIGSSGCLVAGTGRGHNDRVHACSLLLALEAIPIELRLRRIGACPTHGAATQKYERHHAGTGEKRFHRTSLMRLCGIASLKRLS